MPAIQNTRLVPIEERYIEGFRAAVGVVARERRYLVLLDSVPLADTTAFVQRILSGEGALMLAITADDSVVGWCDVVRQQREGLRHVGQLGMGLLPEYRGRGLGRGLAVATLEAARQLPQLERVELQVFASNTRAIALYESLGFVTQGVKKRARKLDGVYDDDVLMGLSLDVPFKAAQRAMKVLSLGWLGLRTPHAEPMSVFFRDVLSLELLHDSAASTRFRLADGTEAHVYGEADEHHRFFGSGPVVGFAVASFAVAHAALVRAGTELLYPEPQRQGGRAWQHFRAADGNVYEIIGPDDRELYELDPDAV